MGNQTTSIGYGQNPTLNSKLVESEPGLQIFQNTEGEQFERYTIPCQPNQENSYQFRVKNRHPQMVDLLYAGQPKGFTCNSPPNIIVVTERIPYRLMHLPPQHSTNAVVILRCAFLGFKDLFKVHGLMSVKENMIGVSTKNRVKVWLNPNFAVNSPQPKPASFTTLDPSQHESQMVNNIFDLINSKAENSSIWKQLTYARQRRRVQSFEEGLTLIDDFLIAHRMNISEEVKNPFNKNIYGGNQEYHSEIDKLEDVRNRSIEGGQGHGSGSQRMVEVRQGQRLQEFKNKIINPPPARNISVDYNRNVPVVQPNRDSRARSPFQQIQKGVHYQSRNGQPRPLDHQTSFQIASSHQHRSTYSSIGQQRTFSPAQKVQVKFKYQGPANISFNPPHIPHQHSEVPQHQIVRSASSPQTMPKPIVFHRQPVKIEQSHVIEQSKVIGDPQTPRDQQGINETLIEDLKQAKEEEKQPVPSFQPFRESPQLSLIQEQKRIEGQSQVQETRQEDCSPTFVLPSKEDIQKYIQKQKGGEVGQSKPIQITVNQVPAQNHQTCVETPHKGQNNGQGIEGGMHQFKVRQAHSINTSGQIMSQATLAARAIVMEQFFPMAKKSVSINQKSASPALKKKQIVHLDKIEQLHTHCAITDSQEVKTEIKHIEHIEQLHTHCAITDSQELKEKNEIVNAESKEKMTSQFCQQAEPDQSVKEEHKQPQLQPFKKDPEAGLSREKLSKMSYKEMRKLLLQTMQN